MFVCICNNVKKSDLVNAISAGITSFEDIQSSTGLATCCGECSSFAQELIETLIPADLFYSAA